MKHQSLLGIIFTLMLVLLSFGPLILMNVPAEWTPPTILSVGYQPHGLCVADLDDNGHKDIVVANSFSDNVTVYFQELAGWQTAQTLTAAGEPEAVAVGDVTGDSNKDIVVVLKEDTEKKIAIFTGTGTGFVSPPAYKNCPQGPMHVAIGDLDGDVDEDIAVAETGGQVRIFYNQGGNLVNSKNLTTDSGTRKVVIADLEGTGTNDIIAINEFRSNLTIWRRNGASWNGPEKLLTGQKPTGLAVADVMGDSNKDIVISNYNENNVTVYEWEGAAWKAPYTLAVGFSPNDVFIADANGDGTKDIVTADLGVSTVTVIPNEGTGWGTKITENVGNDPYAVWVEDMNKDTKLDIITTNSQDGTLSILYWVDNTPPVAYGIPDTFSIKEDTPSNDTFIDLWYYFHDDETADNLLQFSLVNGSDNILIGQIKDDRYFTLQIGPNGEHWYGKRNFTVRCVDQKLDFVEDEFQVTVEPMNDKPDLVSLAGKDILSEELLPTL